MRLRSRGNGTGAVMRLSAAEVAFIDLLIRVELLVDGEDPSGEITDTDRGELLFAAVQLEAQMMIESAGMVRSGELEELRYRMGVPPPRPDGPPEEGEDGITLTGG